MRVNQPGTSPAQSGGVSSSQTAKTKSKSTDDQKEIDRKNIAGSAGEIKTELSERGREMAGIKAAAVSAPDVRESRIAELKKRIAEGSYKVDSKAVAERMVEDHVKMSGLE